MSAWASGASIQSYEMNLPGSAVGLPRRAQFDSVRTRSYKGSIALDDLAALQREKQRPPVDLVNEDGGAR